MSLPRYPKYEDSGVTWLGKVPAHWKIKRLKHCLALLTEKVESCQNKIALENIQSWSGQFLPSDTEFEGDGVAFQQHDILFGKLRPYLAKVFLANSPGEAVGDFHVMRPLEGVIPRYAQYQILNRVFIDLVDGSTFGSKMPRAGWEFVGNMPFPLPETYEQTAIATFLDRETAKIDELIAEQEKLIALLAEKRQATISHAVTKGLNPDAPMKDSGVTWLGEVPEHWSIKPLRYCIDFQEGPGIMAADFEESGVPLLRVSGVQNRWASLDGCNYLNAERVANKWHHFRLEEGDLLISASASMGTVCEIGPDTAGSIPYTGLIRLRGKTDEMIKPFVRSLVVSDEFMVQIDLLKAGATIQHFGPTHLSQMIIARPPIDEQEYISAFIEHESARLDELTAEATRGITLLKERRSALISAAVTGKIDVRHLAEAEAA